MSTRCNPLILLCIGAVLVPCTAFADNAAQSASMQDKQTETASVQPSDSDAEVITVWGKRARQIGTA